MLIQKHKEQEAMQYKRHQWLSLRWSMIPCLVLGLARPGVAEVVTFNLLHLNDVYEITPVQGGKRGGLARVATLRQQLLHQNPRTYTILAGDLLSPSALGTAKVEGVPLAGQQMVAVMNAVGLDYATFGNHEFDLSEAQFRQRLQESRFQWVSSNVSDRQGNAFAQVPRHVILPVRIYKLSRKAPRGKSISNFINVTCTQETEKIEKNMPTQVLFHIFDNRQ